MNASRKRYMDEYNKRKLEHYRSLAKSDNLEDLKNTAGGYVGGFAKRKKFTLSRHVVRLLSLG